MSTVANRMAARLCALAATAVIPVNAAYGQGTTMGYIFGEVDSNSGPVAGATVSAFHPETARIRTAVTEADGRYRFSELAVGRYAVFATLGGLQSSIVPTEVNVGEGTSIELRLENPRAVEEILVIADPYSPLDVTRAETVRIVTSDDVRRLPIPRDPNAVVLMAPGAVQGDQSFGTTGSGVSYGTGSAYASLGGASVAENVYYVNGMNVTNFRNGLGASTIPFEFYDQFQIKTGGYSAEFGRSTGGVVNAVTKRGSNDWRFVLGGYFQPDSLRGDLPNVEHPSESTKYFTADGFDQRDDFRTFVSASGPIVEDRLFVYGIYEARDIEVSDYNSWGWMLRESDDDGFWGLKLDWLLSRDHRLEYTGFSDARVVNRANFVWDAATDTIVRELDGRAISRGGDNHIFNYRGYFGPDLAATVVLGFSEYDLTSTSPADASCPVALDTRNFGFRQLGCWTNTYRGAANDERQVARVNIEWAANEEHLIRFGMDREQNTSFDEIQFSGDGYYQYLSATPGQILVNGGVVPAGVSSITRHRRYSSEGDYEVVGSAFYIEDEWTISAINATLRVGLRNERYDNRDPGGGSIIKMADQFAPRIGFSWDIGGDRNSKIFANYGRYHLPVASVLNILLSSPEFSREDWYVLDQPIAEDGGTVFGAKIGDTTIFADGSLPDSRAVVDRDLKPMEQDEFLLGYERIFWEDYIFGVTYTHRDLKQGIEDIYIDEAIGVFREFNNVLANPGRDVRVFYDTDRDGNLDELRLSAAQLGFPAMKRRYHALTLDLQKMWDGEFYARASYTWSHSYGNYEGTVRSDTGEQLAGATSQFDFIGLLEGADGDLPNDRRHQLKMWGGWEFAPGWQAGTAIHFSTGRPRNAFGFHPSDPYARIYGPLSFFREGEFAPRGSQGRTDNIYRLDLGLKYTANDFLGGALIARLDIFNILDLDAAMEVDERFDSWSTREPSLTYGLPHRFQQPRSVRIGLRFEF